MYRFVGMMVIQVWLPETISYIYMWDSALEPKTLHPMHGAVQEIKPMALNCVQSRVSQLILYLRKRLLQKEWSSTGTDLQGNDGVTVPRKWSRKGWTWH